MIKKKKDKQRQEKETNFLVLNAAQMQKVKGGGDANGPVDEGTFGRDKLCSLPKTDNLCGSCPYHRNG